jgi:polar amino acid transport system substrate-binding protein
MPSSAARSELAPAGTLRAAINFGNPVLAGKDASGQPCGISVDLAREVGRRLAVAVALVHYESAGHVPAAIASNAWDICFLAIDPKRAADIAFTEPYAVIEGAYMAAESSALRGVDEVDRAGTRIGVIEGSAYDLYLTRELRQATLVREASAEAVMNLWVEGMLDVVAGVKPQLETDAARIGGLRLLPGRFMSINQAMGTLRGREAGAGYLREFIAEAKSSGLVAELFARHRITGATMAD